LGTLNL